MKPTLKVHETHRLTLKCDKLPSSFAFNLRPYIRAFGGEGEGEGQVAAGSEPGMNKEKVRALLACIGGVASGFRTRLADFAPNPCAGGAAGEVQPAPIGAQDVMGAAVGVEVRSLAGAYTRSR
jgi:hypothetical protein